MGSSSSKALLVIAGVLAAIVFFGHDDVGRPAPDFDLQGAYGGAFHLDSFRGRPVLLVFWNTNCSICRHELPLLDRMFPEAMRQGVEIAAVNIGDADGAREVMRRMHLLNLVDPDGRTAQRYGVNGVPKLVMIGPDGTIKHSSSGMAGESTLRAWFHS